MAFWNQAALDPKRQYKFKVSFNDGRNGFTPFYLAQSAERPVFTINDTTKVDFLDKAFHFPGKVTWNNVKIKFVDGVGQGNNVASNVHRYLLTSGYYQPPALGNVVTATGADSRYGTVNKLSAQIASLTIDTLNSFGDVEETWVLNNAWVRTAALNQLDYAQEGILTVEYEFRYDWATFVNVAATTA
jgi:hypothetical protein